MGSGWVLWWSRWDLNPDCLVNTREDCYEMIFTGKLGL